MIAAYVFDFDGTLACLPIDWDQLFEKFRAIMHVDNVRPIVDTVSRADDKTRLEIFAVWDKAELAAAKKATLCGEGVNLYRKADGKPKALVTLQGRKVVEVIMPRFGLTFGVVITRENSLFRTQQLLMAAEKLKVPIQDLLFVGNADTDQVAAQKVGCQFHRVK